MESRGTHSIIHHLQHATSTYRTKTWMFSDLHIVFFSQVVYILMRYSNFCSEHLFEFVIVKTLQNAYHSNLFFCLV